MTGVVIAEMPRDVISMNMFSTIAVVHPVADRVGPSNDGSLRGRLSHGVGFSVVLPRTVHPSSHRLFPLPFPAVQPALAPMGRREDIDSRPDLGWCAALKMLMVLRKESRPLFFSFHEECGDDKPMDYYNNLMGRTYGTPGADCRSSCLGGVQSNALQTALRWPA